MNGLLAVLTIERTLETMPSSFENPSQASTCHSQLAAPAKKDQKIRRALEVPPSAADNWSVKTSCKRQRRRRITRARPKCQSPARNGAERVRNYRPRSIRLVNVSRNAWRRSKRPFAIGSRSHCQGCARTRVPHLDRPWLRHRPPWLIKWFTNKLGQHRPHTKWNLVFQGTEMPRVAASFWIQSHIRDFEEIKKNGAE